jgi:hypothetical protein
MAMSPTPEHETTRPRRRYVLLGFILAPLVASLLLAWWAPLFDRDSIMRDTLTYGIFGAYPLAAMIGVPAYACCMGANMRPTWLNCAIVGACVPGGPSLMVALLMAAPQGPGNFIREDGHDLLVNGHTTLWGWWYYLSYVGKIFAVGFAGGLVFWLVTFVVSGFIAQLRCPLKTACVR